MTWLQELGLTIVFGLCCFAMGRYTAVAPGSTTNIVKDQNQVVHTVTQTVTSKDATGAVKTVVTTDTVKQTETKTDKTKEVTAGKPKNNISALVSYNYSRDDKPAYGLAFTREVLGPVTAGVWGMNNGTVGISLGLDF